jgi:hypothetical protein
MSLFLNPAPLRTRTTIQSVHFIETITFFPLLREYLYLDLRRKGHAFAFQRRVWSEAQKLYLLFYYYYLEILEEKATCCLDRKLLNNKFWESLTNSRWQGDGDPCHQTLVITVHVQAKQLSRGLLLTCTQQTHVTYFIYYSEH